MRLTKAILTGWPKISRLVPKAELANISNSGKKLSEQELTKALSIFANERGKPMTLLKAVNQDLSSSKTRQQYVDDLANIMNEVNLPSDKNLPSLQRDHFNKIVDGLNLISDHSRFLKDGQDLTKISARDLTKIIRNTESEQELVKIFDTFYYTGNLTVRMAIEILLNKHLRNRTKQVTSKVLQADHQYIKWQRKDFNDFELSLLQKNVQLGNYDHVRSLLTWYLQNDYWLQNLRARQVSPFAERTLWKSYMALHTDGLDQVFSFLKALNTPESYWLFLESYQFHAKTATSANHQAVNFQLVLDAVASGEVPYSGEQTLLLDFLQNQLKETNRILNISLHTGISGTTPLKRTQLIRDLNEYLYGLKQVYEDFDFTDLTSRLDAYTALHTHGKQEKPDDKVVGLSRLLGFEN